LETSAVLKFDAVVFQASSSALPVAERRDDPMLPAMKVKEIRRYQLLLLLIHSSFYNAVSRSMRDNHPIAPFIKKILFAPRFAQIII
jgi:hypothetical protein